MTVKLTLPKWYDLHAHFRQGEMMPALVKDHLAMGCAGILAMPNTLPPVAKVFENDSIDGWSIESYLAQLIDAGAGKFQEIIIPLYLTAETTPAMIEAGAKSGLLKACKYYPPKGTTNAQSGQPLQSYIDNGVFEAMVAAGMVLCIHGEQHEMPPSAYFDRDQNAEEFFYRETMPRLLETHPDLKIVCEHVTTKCAVDFVREAPAHVGATITPQHLLYTIGDLLHGLKYHLYCLPLLKYEEDRAALREAATLQNNRKFFAGTDSAPHAQKITECGCAAGCYTGGIAPQLYAQAFEETGLDLNDSDAQKIFENFLCLNGAKFYGLPVPQESFTLQRAPQLVKATRAGSQYIKPLPLGLAKDGETVSLTWSIQSPE